jgi:hypothetical protein
VPLYWFLLVKGHRTFKYLSVFGKSFHPTLANRPDQISNHWRINSQHASFGHDYNPVSGVVEFSASRGHLKPFIAEPTEEELAKEATRFFLRKNPGYRQGHELCLPL